MSLPDKISDTILVIQGHLQCQKIKLNVLNITKYEDVIFTYINGKMFFYFEWRMHFCDFVTNTDNNLLQV